MIENDQITAKMVRLYEEEELSLRQIATQFKLTHQAIYLRLKQAGVVFRPRGGKALIIDRKTLVRLHNDEGVPVYKIAKQLEADFRSVVRELKRHRIKRHSVRRSIRRYPELDELKVGQSVEVPKRKVKNQCGAYYSAAFVRGIRVSVRSAGHDLLIITRKA